jgi:OmpA-OmpF porin, OOP family
MKQRIYLIITLFFICAGYWAQSKKVWLTKADEFFEKGDYINALTNYKNVLNDSLGMAEKIYPYEIVITNQKLKNKMVEADSIKTAPLMDYLHHQIGMCYKFTFDYNHAVSQFEKSATSEYYPEDVFFLAEAQMNVQQYQLALDNFEKFIKSDIKIDSLTKKAQVSMTGCYYAMNPKNIRKGAEVWLADTTTFNVGTSSFGAMYWGYEERMIFTSARQGGVVLDPLKQNSSFLCDLYYTEQITKDEWGTANNFGRPVNTGQHEGAGCFNNGNAMFFTRWSDINPNEQNIYLARMIDMKFFEALKLDGTVNVEGYQSVHPFVSMDGSMLYFSSNRPGGMGGFDLWRIEIDPTGMPKGEAENLGAPVNTPYDEVTPFLHEYSSTLFFSSNGHNTIGGLDIFKSSYDYENDLFSKPSNLGMPINSSKDDAYMIWDKYLKNGFLSSDREECPNGHCYKIYHVNNAPIKIMLEGYVFDGRTEEEIPNASITFKDVRYSFEPFTIKTDEGGFYEVELQQDLEIFLKATQTGYFADAANVDTRSITETTVLIQDFYLQQIPTGEIEIEGIEYDYNSDKLRPVSMEILDKLYDFLMLNDNLVVEINSHTDFRGSDKYNLDLSQRRAKSCVDYLISKGISSARLIAKGYGESEPNFLVDAKKEPILDQKGKPIQLTEKYILAEADIQIQELYHQRNRRTAFKVVGQDYKLQSK